MLNVMFAEQSFRRLKKDITFAEMEEKSDYQQLSVQMMKKKFMILLTVQCVAVK